MYLWPILQVILLNADRWRSDDGGREFIYFGFHSIYVHEFTHIVSCMGTLLILLLVPCVMNGKNANLLQH